MDIRPLTKEQRRFAEENHHLVFTFLNQKDLPESAFYDVVIFGYLKAVQEYCEVQALHRFKFSTLAFQRMRSSLSADNLLPVQTALVSDQLAKADNWGVSFGSGKTLIVV